VTEIRCNSVEQDEVPEVIGTIGKSIVGSEQPFRTDPQA